VSVTANKRITSEKKTTLATLIGTNPVKRNLHIEGLKIQLTGFSPIWGLAKIRKLFNLSALVLGMASRFGPENGFENFRNVNYTLYWEHGVEDNLTFFTQGAFVKTRNTDSGVTTFGSGISDIDLGLRYKLHDGPVVVSVQGLFKAPYLYDENAELPMAKKILKVNFSLVSLLTRWAMAEWRSVIAFGPKLLPMNFVMSLNMELI